LNYLFPVFTDDWVYSFVFRSNPPQHITNAKDLLDSQYIHYFTWGGRFVVHFIAQSLLMLKPWMQDLVNAMAFTAFIYMVYKFSNYNRKVNPALFIIIYFFIWFFQPAFGATILWITGSANYLWGTLIILLFIYPYYIFFRNPAYNPRGSLMYISFFIGGILAGWTNENMSVAVVLMLLCMCVCYKKRGTLPKWSIIGCIGFCMGCTLLLAAPGNYVRIDNANSVSELTGTFETILSRLYTMFYHYVYYILPLLIIYITGFIILTKNMAKDENRKKIMLASLIFIVTSHIAFAIMIVSPQFPTRALFGIITFNIIAICILYTNIQISRYYLKTLGALGVMLLLVVLSYDYYRRYNVLNYAHNLWEKRYEYVAQQKQKGHLDIELKERIAIMDSKYHLHELSADTSIWYNRAFARYMEVNSVKISE
jgi:hypothetical protein